MINLLLVGVGKWGQTYISILSEFTNVSLTVANRYSWKQEIDKKPDGVIVCTPPQSHVEIASYSLIHNIPTMIEKPLSLSLKEAEMLLQYSSPILIDHTGLFSSVYQDNANHIDKNMVTYICSTNTGPSLPRDYSELWDYGPHEIAMILDFMQQMPTTVECKSSAPRKFVVALKFDNVQTVSIIGFEEKRNRQFKVLTSNKTYDMLPVHNIEKPLSNALHVFIDVIGGKTDKRMGLEIPIKVMKILELCQKSLDNHKIISV